MISDAQPMAESTATADSNQTSRGIKVTEVDHYQLVAWLVDGTKNPAKAEMAIGEIVKRFHDRLFAYAEKQWGGRGLAYDLEEFVNKTFLLAHNHAPGNNLSVIGKEKAFWGWLKLIIDCVFMDRYRELKRKHDLTTAMEKMIGVTVPKDNNPESPNYQFPNKRYTQRRKKKELATGEKSERGSKRLKILLEIYYKYEALFQSRLWYHCVREFSAKLTDQDKEILGYNLNSYNIYTGIWDVNNDSLENQCEKLKVSVKTFRARRSRLKQRWFDFIMSYKSDAVQGKPQFDIKKWDRMIIYDFPPSYASFPMMR